jgi:group I intron endonuclease
MSSTICKIYVLTNIKNNKIYIGQTWEEDVEDRKGTDGRSYGGCSRLFAAIQEYGIENFKYSILELCYAQNMADYFETYFIRIFNTQNEDIGYNLKAGGSSGAHSEATIQKMVLAHTEERKAKNSEMMKKRHATQGHPMKGQHHTEEIKEQISKTLTGRVLPPEQVAKSAKSREMPQEKQKKIAEMYKTDEFVDKILETFGIKTSGLYRVLRRFDVPLRGQKINNGTGKQHTEETKAKMAQSQKEMWAKRKATK